MIIPSIEGDDHLPVPSLTQCDAVTVIGVLEQRHLQPSQGMAASEGVCHAVLTSRVNLGDDENVIEQKYLSLVLTF